jgi:hypothetical protein
MGGWWQQLPWIGAAAGLLLAIIEYFVLGIVARSLSERHSGDAAVQRAGDGSARVRFIEGLRKANFVVFPALGFVVGWFMRA